MKVNVTYADSKHFRGLKPLSKHEHPLSAVFRQIEGRQVLAFLFIIIISFFSFLLPYFNCMTVL